MNLTDKQWEIAHAIAIELVQENTDANEVSKTVAYLRTIIDKNNATSTFLTYLKVLVKEGKMIGHSKQTSEYYSSINDTCNQYFKANSDPQTILQILGWVSRLMKYYNNSGVPIGGISAPVVTVVESARQAEIAKVTESQEFKEGDIIEAKVTKINGNKVTYEILGVIKITEKEPKKASLLQEGQEVKVKIGALKEDGSIKSVKCAE
ncbi:hypothetical protein H6F32_08770 [Anabaena sp. FACHB-1237]|uniref:hypothetical protein n=1 Tax=Anabaena sp. FACHB-1237 TaxID=2692769 RepID=UPI00168000F7|nr:hypothetical protein [Anabaena sp. FACHB-1237]MBD2137675.1 hypothetical protein [Anabaena sp. FACHB-1237]